MRSVTSRRPAHRDILTGKEEMSKVRIGLLPVALTLLLLGVPAVATAQRPQLLSAQTSQALMQRLRPTLSTASDIQTLNQQIGPYLSRQSTQAKASTAFPGVYYGLADAQGTYFYCNTSSCPSGTATYATCPTYNAPCSVPLQGYGVAGGNQNSAYTTLKSAVGPQFVVQRFFIPYDAIESANSSGACGFSNALANGWYEGPGNTGRYHPSAEAWSTLYAGLQTAAADGVVPLVSISAAPDSVASGEPLAPDPSIKQQYNDYLCGVQGIMNALAGTPFSVHNWEAFNEPDVTVTYNGHDNVNGTTCSEFFNGNQDGAAKAACIWRLGDYLISTGAAGHATDNVAAGGLSWPSTHYFDAYVKLLKAQNNQTKAWSVHDYGDVGAAAFEPPNSLAFQLVNFDQDLARQYPNGPAPIWLTEVSNDLTSNTTSYNGHTTLPCTTLHEADNNPGGQPTLGACNDGFPSAQTSAANMWLALPADAAASGGVPVSMELWYGFQPPVAPSNSGFDAGLVAPDGALRLSYCVLAGFNASACDGSSHEAQDYSSPGG